MQARRRLEDYSAPELLARILGVKVADLSEAEARFDAGRLYAETIPPRELARLVARSLDVGDEATALAAAYTAMNRGEADALAVYGLRRPEKLDPIERWSTLVYGEAA